MARPRVFLGLLAAWLAVVVVGSTAVWAVISRTGQELAPVSGPRLEAPAKPTPKETPRASDPASIAPAPDPIKPSPPAEPTPTPSDPASAGPGAVDPGAGDNDGSGDGEGDGGSDGGTDGGEVKRGTWTGKGGTVFAECSARGMRVSAVSDPGFHVEADVDDGRGRVKFESTGERELEIVVYVACRSGGPTFYAHFSDDDD